MSNRTAWVSATAPPVASDQAVGGTVVLELWLLSGLELRDDPLRELLAQLDAPLVEGVDVPDRALGEDGVLVERHQRAEGVRGEAVGEDHVRGPVPLHHPVG